MFKRILQSVSVLLTLALVFSIVTCAPFSAHEASPDELAATGANVVESFGEPDDDVYTLTDDTIYRLTDDVKLEGYINVPSDVTAVIDLNGHTVDRGLADSVATDDFIVNNGTLTIKDSSSDNSGVLTGGYAYKGGVVNNKGTLIIEGGTFMNNRAFYEAGAVLNDSGKTLTVKGGVFSNNSTETYGGGAFVNFGTMTFEGGYIKGNRAKMDGGGIFNSGVLTVTGGRISGNYAEEGEAGGLFNSMSGQLYVSGSPFISNNANGNLYLKANSLIQVNGAITSDAKIDVRADNMPRPVTSGFSDSPGNNRGVFTFGGGHTLAAQNQSGEITPDVDPTVTVNSWSALKNAVNNAEDGDYIALSQSITNTDKEKSIHVSGKRITVDLCGHTVDVNRQNESTGDDYHFMYSENDAVLTVKDSFGGGVIKNGNATNGGAFDTDDNSDAYLYLYNITLEDNKASEDGGAVRNRANLFIDGCVIRNNTSGDDGGAVMIYDGADSCYIRNTVISGNQSGSQSGAIDLTEDIEANIANTFIENNTSDDLGGGVYVRDGSVNVTGGAFEGNSSTEGGAVYVTEGSTFTAEGTAFIGNDATGNDATNGSGGAVYSHGNVTLTDCHVSGNTATGRGGALYNANNADSTAVTNTIFSDNTAERGGAVYVYDGSVELNNCAVIGNKANATGGALFADYDTSDNDPVFKAVSTVFEGNSSGTYSGGAIAAHTDIILDGCTVTGNTATTTGSGVWTDAKLNISGLNVITGNTGDNVYLADNATISRYGALTAGTQIGFKAQNYDRFTVTGLTQESEGDYFVLDEASTESYDLSQSCVKPPLFTSYSVYVKKTVMASVSSWNELQTAINNAAYATVFKLTQTLNADGASAMRIPDGKDITIDLNGYDLNRGLTKEGSAGHVIQMKGSSKLTVRDTSSTKDGKITGGWSEHGGGINVEEDGTLRLESGYISGNHAKYGGGVFLADDAEFTMTGGSITENIASQDGGGIFADYPATVTGGTIANNKAKYGGGYYFDEPDMTAELSKVTISGNTATENGGGIYVWHGTVSLTDNVTVKNNTAVNGGGAYVTDKCTLTAKNAVFEKNEATVNGGGIRNDENLYLTSCTFTENKAGRNAGAVYNCDHAEITDCTMKKNKALDGTGGAIKQYDGGIIIDGGEISENLASYRGGGVYVDEESNDEKFRIKGNVIINNNVGSDVFLDEDEIIKVDDVLGAQASVRVSLYNVDGTFTKDFATYHPGEDPAKYFSADPGYAVIPDDDGEGMVIESDWTLLRREFLKDESTYTVKLTRDWTAKKDDTSVVVPQGKNITLDLNGHTVDGDEAISDIIQVSGTLTVKDTSAAGNGKISGSDGGSGIHITSTGKVNLQSGEISGNSSNSNGGGIKNNGILNVTGGSVIGNEAKKGGGIYNAGTATISGGTISDNTAKQYGGGIFNTGSLTITGGEITGNNGVREGGGVYMETSDSTVLAVSDKPVINDNTSPIGNNILLNAGTVVTIAGSLNQTAELDVVTKDSAAPLTAGYGAYGSPEVFTYNGKTNLMVEKNSELYLRQISGTNTADSWEALQTAINNSTAGDIIVLTDDLDGSDKSRLKVEDKTLTIELNGHKIDRKRTSGTSNGQVFGVMGNSHLTISDNAGTGIITGGRSHDGGGVFIDTNATLTITGGSIEGNNADNDGGDGGGVYNQGTLIMEGGSISFNRADDTGGGIYSTKTGTIKLNNALITGNYTDDDDGGGMNLHLKNNDSYIYNSVISNNSCDDNHGGGIRIEANKKALTIRNTKITGNEADEQGGGIKLTDGTLWLYNCVLNYNEAEDGGAIYTEHSTSFHAYNTEFNYNKTEGHGAGGINCQDKMELTDCSVNYNKAEESGGGIYMDVDLDTTVKLTDTEVDYNKTSKGEGGGIKIKRGNLELIRGSVSHNWSFQYGGGIYLTQNDTKGDEVNLKTFKTKIDHNFTHTESGGGIFIHRGIAILQGGSVSNNFAKYNGGGIQVTDKTELYIEDAVETVDGTETRESIVFNKNDSQQAGGAIYLEDDGSLYLHGGIFTENHNRNNTIFANEDFYISGKIIIKSNDGQDIFMNDDDDKIHLDGKLDPDSDIGVSLDWKTGKFTDGFKTYHEGEDPTIYFHTEDGYAIAPHKDGEVRVKSTDWIYLQNEINAATNDSTIQLSKSYTADEADSTLVIPTGKKLTIDLNGNSIDGGNEITSVIEVKSGANLTLKDSLEIQEEEETEEPDPEEQTVEIPVNGVRGATASGIVNKGTLTLNSGWITANRGDTGAGIDNYGTLNINGGYISKNTAETDGGGIYNRGMINLYGGKISSNTAVNGGGIFCAPGSNMHVKGAPYVYDNSSPTAKNILLSKGTVITIDEKLSAAAKLDVAVKDYKNAITKNFVSSQSPSSIFSYNENDDITLVQKNNELYFPYTLDDVDVWVSTWAGLQDAVNDDDNRNKIIGLTNDLGADGQERIEVEDGRVVTIELAGCTMDRALTSKTDQGNVFKVSDDNTSLTIRDTVGTGAVRGGYAKGDGGGFYVVDDAKLTIESGSIQSNKASSDGAGIYVDDAELVMTGGSVSHNESGDNGGGIYNSSSAKITLSKVTITGNFSDNAGGGLNLHLKADTTFTECVISNNESDDSDGGGLVMNASGRTLTLKDCTLNNNIADDEGGAVYVDAGTVIMDGGVMDSNTSDDGGAVYITGGDWFKMRNKAVISNNKTEKYSGGGITCHGLLEINDATVKQNHSERYGGGVFYQNSGDNITLTDAHINYNKAEKDGGGIYIKQGKVTLDGGSVTGNTSVDGGGIFVTDDTELVAQNGTVISSNTVTEEDGGGIVNAGKTTLEDVTIKLNKAKLNGGGIWSDDELYVKDCTIEENKATREYGGGIHVEKGDLTLEGVNKISGNSAGAYGAGISVAEEAKDIEVKGKITILDNLGSNLYLAKSRKLKIIDPLVSGSKISVSIYDEYGTFTKDFKKHHSAEEPSKYFESDFDFLVYKNDDGEGALTWEEDESNPFVEKKDQIRDADKVTGRNWMSAVSGERKLNEINLIRAHDAAMNDVEGNMNSSNVRLMLTIGAAVIGVLMIGIGIFTGGIGLVVGGLFAASAVYAIALAFQVFASLRAKTQYLYIDEQMNMGVRIFDLRINHKNYEDNTIYYCLDDNENLWHCHGESKEAGTFYGLDHDGNILSVDKTLEWAKEFLKKNPSEVLFFEYSLETFDNDDADKLVFTRLKYILKQFSYEVNPSTGKPYLYMEDGVYDKELTYWPKLKDVRGQMIFKTAGKTNIGGYEWDMAESPDYSRSLGQNDTVNTPEERINQTLNAIEQHPSPKILTDALVHRGVNSGYYINTTDDPNAMFKWLKGEKSWVTKTPLDLEEKILYGTDDYDGVFEEGGPFNQTGEYYGLFSFDGVTEKEARICWGSNFYDKIQYRTITVKSGIAGDEEVKTYKVLKGTPITIPACIYEKPQSGDSYFQYWRAVTQNSGSWDPDYALQSEEVLGYDYDGQNNREYLMSRSYLEPIDPDTQIPQNSTRDVKPGETITIMDDTEFTAVWGSDVMMPVSVVWEDGDNADELRTNSLQINYQDVGLAEIKSETVEENEQWNAMLSGNVDINTIKVNWDQIKTSVDKPQGNPENGYSYKVTATDTNGFIITMYHQPNKTVKASGKVTWDDDDNAMQVRPDSVTVRLMKNGEKVDSVTTNAAANWSYNFGTFPEYVKVEEGEGNDKTVTYQRDIYTIKEDSILFYSAAYEDFDINNIYTAPEISDVNVEIDWKDASNSYGERPDSITLHLFDGDTEIDKQVVQVDDASAVTLCYFDVEQYEMSNLGKEFHYSVTQEDIPNYNTEVKLEGNTVTIVNDFDKSDKHFQKHSLSLNGDIGVNFYLNLTAEELSTAKIHFEWFNKELDLTAADLEYNQELGLYKASCPVAVAEMTYDIIATLSVNGADVESNRYSVVRYANVILTDKDFINNYIDKIKAETGSDEIAQQKYMELYTLTAALLEYGSKAQIAFDRNTGFLANGGEDLFPDDITSDDIDSIPSDMNEGAANYGLEYQYTAVVYLSKTSLRHYYKIVDQAAFDTVRENITFDGQSVTPVERGDLVFFEKQSIAASELGTQFSLVIGENEYLYSVMDYTKKLIDSDNDETFIELAKETYRVYKAAKAYFED